MDTLYNKEERLENKKVINLIYPILFIVIGENTERD